MARPVDRRKWHEWRRRMRRFEKTQRSIAAFCRGEGVSEASFYQWRRRLARPTEARKGKADKATGGFTPVRLAAVTGVTVRLPGGTQLQVPTSDPQVLRLVIATLARVDARRAGGGPC